MIRDKSAPDDVIHIRQIWLKAINRVAESIAYRYRHDILQNGQYVEAETGIQTVIESVISLHSLLVDYGEALVLTDVNNWHREHEMDFKDAKSDFNRMHVYRRWFLFMVQTLNKYNMLFDSQPKGYSNVEMKSV